MASIVGVEHRSRAFARRLLADTRAALEAHARRFGAYPWPTFTVVASSMDRFDWETHPSSLVRADRPHLSTSVAHEAAHQWF
jgi:hypothetical protein